MFLLAGPIQYNEPPQFYLSFLSGSSKVKKLPWYKLAPKTQKNYFMAIESYKTFCMLSNITAWPAFTQSLEK